METLSFGAKAYSAAKISAVLERRRRRVAFRRFAGAEASLDDLHSSSTRIS
jgi:hypothetical protein